MSELGMLGTGVMTHNGGAVIQMVQFEQGTPLGIPVYLPDVLAEQTELIRGGHLAGVDLPRVKRAAGQIVREAALREASGRWETGRPDPAQFVPGDVAAIRSIVGDRIAVPGLLAETQAELDQFVVDLAKQHQRESLSVLTDLAGAAPLFVPTAAALATLAGAPPPPEALAGLRLPYERVLVVFGTDLKLDWTAYPWSADYLELTAEFPNSDVVPWAARKGGFVSGMVLLADRDGHLRDDLLWLLAGNPDPLLPWPASLDRIRGVVRGWRSMAELAPLVTRVAALVAWGSWQPPPTLPRRLPEVPFSKAWERAVTTEDFRKTEPAGAAIGVRVFDPDRTIATASRATAARTQPAQASWQPPQVNAEHALAAGQRVVSLPWPSTPTRLPDPPSPTEPAGEQPPPGPQPPPPDAFGVDLG